MLFIYSSPSYSDEKLFFKDEKVFGSVAKLNGLSTVKGEGVIGEMISLIGSYYSNFDYELVPFVRSLSRLQDEDVDFQYPIFESDLDKKNFLASSFYAHRVRFGLFFHRDKKVSIEDILGADQKIIPIVEKIHEKSFGFKVGTSICSICVIRKINDKREVAGIYEITSTLSIIEKEKLKNIEVIEFGRYESKFSFKNNDRGKRLESQFKRIIADLKAKKRLPRLYKE